MRSRYIPPGNLTAAQLRASAKLMDARPTIKQEYDSIEDVPDCDMHDWASAFPQPDEADRTAASAANAYAPIVHLLLCVSIGLVFVTNVTTNVFRMHMYIYICDLVVAAD